MSGQAKKAESKKGQKQAQAGATKAEDTKTAVPQVKTDGKEEAKDTTLPSTSVGLPSKQEAVSLSQVPWAAPPSKTPQWLSQLEVSVPNPLSSTSKGVLTVMSIIP